MVLRSMKSRDWPDTNTPVSRLFVTVLRSRITELFESMRMPSCVLLWMLLPSRRTEAVDNDDKEGGDGDDEGDFEEEEEEEAEEAKDGEEPGAAAPA